MASDVDLVILGDDPGERLVRSQRWGPVQERRYRLRSGLLVEFGFAPVDWAAVPLEAGAQRVLEDGHRVLFDDGTLTAASEAVR
jgi:hypothetical protein